MIMTQSEAVLLSLLGPKPVFWYNKRHDTILCAWNGIVMTQSHALMLIGEFFWKQTPTPEMRRVADKDFYILYKSGAFENTEKWDNIINDNVFVSVMHSYYKKKLKVFIENNLGNTKPDEVYRWLNLEEFCQYN